MTTGTAPPIGDWDELVRRALDGEQAAWTSIVDALSGVVWRVLMSYRLSPADREDAFASTFFRLYERLSSVREPQRLPGWVATVAKNEANAIWRAKARVSPSDVLPLQEVSYDSVEDDLCDRDLLAGVMRAFGLLPAQSQLLLRLLTAVPALSYDDISRLLDMPKGSIGPTAGRLLQRLRRSLHVPDDGGLRR